jgi:ATP-dependent Clp protease ATP-binding subunit ClpA
MREVVLKHAINESITATTCSRSMFFTPEHLLLHLLGDSKVQRLLHSVGVDSKKFGKSVVEYVDRLPVRKGQGLLRPIELPIYSIEIPRVLRRIRERGNLKQVDPANVPAINFLEAYVYVGINRTHMHLVPTVQQILAPFHGVIETMAYAQKSA